MRRLPPPPHTQVMNVIFDNYQDASGVNFATALNAIAKKARKASPQDRRKVVGGPAFRDVVGGAAKSAAGMKPRDLANSLWALGSLRYVADKSVARLAAAATARADELNTRDLSTALWALGSMRHKDPAFLRAAEARLAADFDAASDQDLVMALAALGQHGAGPGPLLTRCLDRLAATDEADVASWGSPAYLGVLARAVSRSGAYRGPFWLRIETALLGGALPPREAANVFGAMAAARHQPPRAVVQAALDLVAPAGDVVAGDRDARQAHPMDVAQCVHAAAVLRGGVAERSDGPLALEGAVRAAMKGMGPRELALCAWALAVTGPRAHGETLQRLTDALGRARALRDDSLRQVMQVLLLCEGAGAPLEADPGLEQAAAQAWMAAAAASGDRLGSVTRGVAGILERLGANCRAKVRTMDGMLVVEVGVRGGEGELAALEVLHRRSCAANTGAILGSDWARAQLLRSQGWGVEHIASSDWHSREHAGKVALVAMLLEKQGMGADPAVVEEVAAGDAEAPDEPSVTDDESEGEPVAEALA